MATYRRVTDSIATLLRAEDDKPEVIRNTDFGTALAAATRRDQETELLNLRHFEIDERARLPDNLQWSRHGLDRFLKVLGLPKTFMDTLCATKGSHHALDCIRHMARNYTKGRVDLAVYNNRIIGAFTEEQGHSTHSYVLESLQKIVDNSDALNEVQKVTFDGMHMYMQIVTGDDLVREHCLVGDIVKAGITLKTGADGGIRTDLSGFLYRLWCTNGCVSPVNVGHRDESAPSFEKLESMAHDALTRSVDLLPFLRQASQVELNEQQLHMLSLKTADRFGSAFSRNVVEHAFAEMRERKQTAPSMYDYWNGVTGAAKSYERPAYRERLETYGSEVLRNAHQRFQSLEN